MEKPITTPVPDGTEADFRDLLDFACTTPAKPVFQPAPMGKPESVESNTD